MSWYLLGCLVVVDVVLISYKKFFKKISWKESMVSSHKILLTSPFTLMARFSKNDKEKWEPAILFNVLLSPFLALIFWFPVELLYAHVIPSFGVFGYGNITSTIIIAAISVFLASVTISGIAFLILHISKRQPITKSDIIFLGAIPVIISVVLSPISLSAAGTFTYFLICKFFGC